MSESERTAPKRPREPDALSTEYHKAHKQLMLWAAILFVWEFVGIDLDKAKDAEGYAGALVKSIKSPQAVPWVLLALVVYFLFKCSTEWAQCHSERRKLRFARADFVSAWLVAVAAIALYIGQAVSHSQFADTLQDKSFRVSLILSFCIGLPLTAITLRRVGASPPNRWPVAIVVSYEIVALPLISASIIHGTPLRWVVLFVSLTAMTVLIGAVLLFGKVLGVLPKK